MEETIISPGCPWHGLYKLFGPPTIKWCEARLCGLVTEPFNTWTNIPYMILAIVVYFRLRNHSSPFIRAFAPVMFILGFFSFIYHMMNNFGAQMLDFLGMYLMTSLILVINIQRLKANRFFWRILFFSCIVTFNLLLIPTFLFLGIPIQYIILLNIAVIIATELAIYKKNGKTENGFIMLIISLIFLALGISFSILDLMRISCNPENHYIQGHGVWHILSAIGIFASHYYFATFE